MQEDVLKEIAAQLRCPSGKNGEETGLMMQASNKNMTQQALLALEPIEVGTVLEIGHGKGEHIAGFLQAKKQLHYKGLDISPVMHEQAKEKSETWIEAGRADFYLYEGDLLPFAKDSLNAIVTVNTIYFWNNPLSFAKEIYRVLQPSGKVVIGFAQEKFMKTLPFTSFGFTLYNTEKVIALFLDAGFTSFSVQDYEENVMSKTGEAINRSFSIYEAIKSAE